MKPTSRELLTAAGTSVETFAGCAAFFGAASLLAASRGFTARIFVVIDCSMRDLRASRSAIERITITRRWSGSVKRISLEPMSTCAPAYGTSSTPVCASPAASAERQDDAWIW